MSVPLPESLSIRYGTHAPNLQAPDAALPVLEQILNHRSVRNFLPDALPEGTLETLVAAAQSAATSSNLQAWSVVAVEAPERRAQLAELVGQQKHVRQAPLFLAWLADVSRIERLAQYQQQRAEGVQYLDTTLLAVIDAALAAQNAVLAAEALGLGTVYIGGLRNQPEAVAELLGTPAGVFPIFGLVVGRPDPAARPAAIKPRLAQSAVLHRERYQVAQNLEDEIGDFDQRLGAFQAEQGMPASAWSQQVVTRLRDAAALHGRDQLSQSLQRAGLSLR